MNQDTFIEERLKHVLELVVADPNIHARWLNSLSYLENCGARKIASFEDRTHVKENVLRHAAEEFRHAHFMKVLISKLNVPVPEDYNISSLLGSFVTYRYLDILEIKVCRYLKSLSLSKKDFKDLAYLLVTNAIERRAELLYPVYQDVLQRMQQKISVRSIILEEEQHLEETGDSLKKYPHWQQLLSFAINAEQDIFKRWFDVIETEVPALACK